MEYVKTFVLLAVFIILSIGCVANIIRHTKENKEARKEAREAKKKAKAEKKMRRKARLMGIKLEPEKPEQKKVIREYDLEEEDM